MALPKKHGCPSSAEWPDRAVSILLKTYAQKFSVDRGYLRTQDWQDVALAVNTACDNLKTLKQCRDKVDSLKRRYKMEKRKAVSGSEVSWPFFHRLDDIMNSVLNQGKGLHPKHLNASSAHASADTEDEDDIVYVDEVEEFQEEEDEDEEDEEDEEKVEQAADENKGREYEEGGADDDDDDDDQKLDASVSLSASSDRPPYVENGKSVGHVPDDYDVSDEEDTANGHSYHRLHFPYGGKHNCLRHNRQALRFPHARHGPAHVYHDHPFLQRAPSRLYAFSGGTHESTQNSSQGKSTRARNRARKRKLENGNGIDTLANAVTGLSKPGSVACFSDVFAHIDLAKVQILKKVRLEVAKLDRKLKKAGTPSTPRLSMSTSS